MIHKNQHVPPVYKLYNLFCSKIKDITSRKGINHQESATLPKREKRFMPESSHYPHSADNTPDIEIFFRKSIFLRWLIHVPQVLKHKRQPKQKYNIKNLHNKNSFCKRTPMRKYYKIYVNSSIWFNGSRINTEPILKKHQ